MNYDSIQKIDTFNVHKGVRQKNFKKKEHHYHNWYEIFIVLSGECRFSVYDKFYNIRKGEAMLFQPGVFHYYTSPLGCEYLIIEVTAGYISRFFSADAANILLKCFNSVLIALSDDELSECVRLAQIADNETNSDMPDRLLAIGGILNIFTKADKKQHTENLYSKRKNTVEKLNYITNYIAENYKNITSITDLAKSCYISKSHMCGIFRRELGVSVSNYINNLKIDLARELLITTKMSVIDISVECGFNSTQYFHKTFKNQLGCSPTEYRRQNKAEN